MVLAMSDFFYSTRTAIYKSDTDSPTPVEKLSDFNAIALEYSPTVGKLFVASLGAIWEIDPTTSERSVVLKVSGITTLSTRRVGATHLYAGGKDCPAIYKIDLSDYSYEVINHRACVILDNPDTEAYLLGEADLHSLDQSTNAVSLIRADAYTKPPLDAVMFFSSFMFVDGETLFYSNADGTINNSSAMKSIVVDLAPSSQLLFDQTDNTFKTSLFFTYTNIVEAHNVYALASGD